MVKWCNASLPHSLLLKREQSKPGYPLRPKDQKCQLHFRTSPPKTIISEDVIEDLTVSDRLENDNDGEIIADPRWLKYVALTVLGLVIVGAVFFFINAIEMEIAELVLRERMDAKWELYTDIQNLKK
jgi:hypothetical protein